MFLRREILRFAQNDSYLGDRLAGGERPQGPQRKALGHPGLQQMPPGTCEVTLCASWGQERAADFFLAEYGFDRGEDARGYAVFCCLSCFVVWTLIGIAVD